MQERSRRDTKHDTKSFELKLRSEAHRNIRRHLREETVDDGIRKSAPPHLQTSLSNEDPSGMVVGANAEFVERQSISPGKEQKLLPTLGITYDFEVDRFAPLTKQVEAYRRCHRNARSLPIRPLRRGISTVLGKDWYHNVNCRSPRVSSVIQVAVVRRDHRLQIHVLWCRCLHAWLARFEPFAFGPLGFRVFQAFFFVYRHVFLGIVALEKGAQN